MTSPDLHIVNALNSFVETVVDSADGYRKAGDAAENPRFHTTFSDRAKRRQELAAKLQAEVRRQGAKPEDEGTVLAKAHRAFLDIKDNVTGHSDKAVIEEVERGEGLSRANSSTPSKMIASRRL